MLHLFVVMGLALNWLRRQAYSAALMVLQFKVGNRWLRAMLLLCQFGLVCLTVQRNKFKTAVAIMMAPSVTGRSCPFMPVHLLLLMTYWAALLLALSLTTRRTMATSVVQ